MSKFIPPEQEETADWQKRQEAFNSPTQGIQGGRDYAEDILHRAPTGFSSWVGQHPEHLSDFRRFALDKTGKNLLIPRFDIYIANDQNLTQKYSPLIPQISENDKTKLTHAMYSGSKGRLVKRDPAPQGQGNKAAPEMFVYVCIKGYNESAEQFVDNQANRDGKPWFIAEEAWIETDAQVKDDQHGEPGEQDIRKYVKVGKINTKTLLCETYIGQEMYLHYDAPPVNDEIVTYKMSSWWEPKLSRSGSSWVLRIGKGCNLVPTAPVGSQESILPESYWKRELCYRKGFGPIRLFNRKNYFWVGKKLTHNVPGDGTPEQPGGYLVADQIVAGPGALHGHDEADPAQPEALASIRSHYLVTTLADNDYESPAVDRTYSFKHTDQPAKPTDIKISENPPEYIKYQFLGQIHFNAGQLETFEWRLNHTFYWDPLNAPVGSYGDTSGGDGTITDPGRKFGPGEAGQS